MKVMKKIPSKAELKYRKERSNERWERYADYLIWQYSEPIFLPIHKVSRQRLIPASANVEKVSHQRLREFFQAM